MDLKIPYMGRWIDSKLTRIHPNQSANAFRRPCRARLVLVCCAKRLLRPCEPQSTTCPYASAYVRNPTNAHENYLSAFWTLWAGGSLKKSQMVQKGDPHKQRLAKHTGILRDPLFSSFFWFFEKSFL